MSVKQMALVWEHEFDHSEQSIMLALADHAHDDGSEIRPSALRLAWKTGYEVRQVYRILKRLRDDMKILKLVRKGGGRGKPNVYRFDWSNAVKKSPFAEYKERVTSEGKTLTSENVNPDIEEENPDTAMSEEPSTENHQGTEPSEESSGPTGGDSSVVTTLGGGEAIPTNKYLTTMFYDRVKEVHKVTLKSEQFSFHLGAFRQMVKDYPNLSVPEMEEVVEHMVEVLPKAPKIDALKAVQDVVMGRTTGTAFKNKAPKAPTSGDRAAGYEELFGPQGELSEEEQRKLQEVQEKYEEPDNLD